MTDRYEALRKAAEKLPPGYDYVMDKEEILELLDELAALKVALITIAELQITQLDHRFPQDAVNMQIVARETLTREGLIYNVRKEQQP